MVSFFFEIFSISDVCFGDFCGIPPLGIAIAIRENLKNACPKRVSVFI